MLYQAKYCSIPSIALLLIRDTLSNIIVAYDGATYQQCKGGKVRRPLDNKVAYFSFETVNEFRRNKEAVIASKYNNDEIELIVKNGDGAQWIQKDKNSNCICVLDEFHRNKKITECVSDKNIAEALNSLLFSGQYQLLLEVIEAYINSIEDVLEDRNKTELSTREVPLPDYIFNLIQKVHIIGKMIL